MILFLCFESNLKEKEKKKESRNIYWYLFSNMLKHIFLNCKLNDMPFCGKIFLNFYRKKDEVLEEMLNELVDKNSNYFVLSPQNQANVSQITSMTLHHYKSFFFVIL